MTLTTVNTILVTEIISTRTKKMYIMMKITDTTTNIHMSTHTERNQDIPYTAGTVVRRGMCKGSVGMTMCNATIVDIMVTNLKTAHTETLAKG